MFHEIGYEVKRLVRIRIGNLWLSDLPRGHWRLLTKREVKSLSHGSNARE
jgi:23S rRNA pseudouridine2605 synthase